MSTVEDVEVLVGSLGGVAEGTTWGNRCWAVGKRNFAWLRPFTKADIRRFGDERIPEPPILAVRTPDLETADGIVSAMECCFTIPHFNGFAAVLVELGRASQDELEDLLEMGWLWAGGEP